MVQTDGGEGSPVKAFTIEQRNKFNKNLITLNSRINSADNSVWLDKLRLGFVLYHARRGYEKNFYTYVNEAISKKTVQRYTKMILDTKSAELYGVRGTDFNDLTVDKRLENLVGYDSSKDFLDDACIDSSNHGTVKGLVTTKEKNDDGEEIEKTEEGDIVINISGLTASKITKMKKLEDKEFYMVVGGDDSPLDNDSGKTVNIVLEGVKKSLSAYVTEGKLKSILNMDRTELLSEILNNIKDIDGKKTENEALKTQIGGLTFKLTAMQKQFGELPEAAYTMNVLSPDQMSLQTKSSPPPASSPG